jgi:hypothetical protein
MQIRNWFYRYKLQRSAIRAAELAFQADHLHTPILWAHIQVEEMAHFVVRIGYDLTRPPRLAFYSVSKVTNIAWYIIDDIAYRPSVWR